MPEWFCFVFYSSSFFSVFLFIPQISYGSKGNFFTEQVTKYLYFIHAIPLYAKESKALALLIARNGWLNVELIFSADDYGSGAASAFEKRLTQICDFIFNSILSWSKSIRYKDIGVAQCIGSCDCDALK